MNTDPPRMKAFCVGRIGNTLCTQPLSPDPARYEARGNYCGMCCANAKKQAYKRKWEGKGDWRDLFLVNPS